MIATVRELKLLPHKPEVDPDNWDKVHVNLRILAYEAYDWCIQQNLPFVVTSIIRPMIPGVSKTDIHSKGRAFDLSVKGWAADQCLAFEQYMNDNFSSKFGAISLKDNKPRACVFHNGTGFHMHLQVKP